MRRSTLLLKISAMQRLDHADYYAARTEIQPYHMESEQRRAAINSQCTRDALFALIDSNIIWGE